MSLGGTPYEMSAVLVRKIKLNPLKELNQGLAEALFDH